jgi:hypothetical protein
MAPEQPEATWAGTALPIVTRLRLHAAIGFNCVHTPEGARYLAAVIEIMAERLDRAVALQLAQGPAAPGDRR